MPLIGASSTAPSRSCSAPASCLGGLEHVDLEARDRQGPAAARAAGARPVPPVPVVPVPVAPVAVPVPPAWPVEPWVAAFDCCCLQRLRRGVEGLGEPVHLGCRVLGRGERARQRLDAGADLLGRRARCRRRWSGSWARRSSSASWPWTRRVGVGVADGSWLGVGRRRRARRGRRRLARGRRRCRGRCRARAGGRPGVDHRLAGGDGAPARGRRSRRPPGAPEWCRRRGPAPGDDERDGVGVGGGRGRGAPTRPRAPTPAAVVELERAARRRPRRTAAWAATRFAWATVTARVEVGGVDRREHVAGLDLVADGDLDRPHGAGGAERRGHLVDPLAPSRTARSTGSPTPVATVAVRSPDVRRLAGQRVDDEVGAGAEHGDAAAERRPAGPAGEGASLSHRAPPWCTSRRPAG